MNWYLLAEEIEPDLKAGRIDTCINQVIREIRKHKDSPFHKIIDLKFSNKPRDVATYISTFLFQESCKIEIKCLYCELNGFHINPYIWFFDLFAYDTLDAHNDSTWLSEWKSDRYEGLKLTGLEDIQEIYANYEEGKYLQSGNDYSTIKDMCSLLIILHFQDLIKETASLIKNLPFPLLAGSHNCDFIYKYHKQP